MKVTITIEGTIKTSREKIGTELVVPDNWKPSFNEYCKVKGAVRFITETLAQNYEPPAKVN